MTLFFAIVYLIVEFLRPQQMYHALAGLPLAQISILGSILAFLVEKGGFQNRNLLNMLLLIMSLWICLSYAFAFNRDLAYPALLDFLKIVVINFLLINILNDKRKLYLFVIVLLLIQLKLSQFCIRQFLNAGIGVTGIYGGAGFFANPGDLGTALATFFGISYYLAKSDSSVFLNWIRMKWFFSAVALAAPIAIISTNSRGPSLAFGICLLAIWFKGKRKVLGVAAIFAILAIFIALIPNWDRYRKSGSVEDQTGRTRLVLWSAAARMASDYPVTGVGPNNFVEFNQRRYQSDLALVQHNIFYQVLSELGYPGLIIYLALMSACFWNHRKIRNQLRLHKIEEPFFLALSHGIDVALLGFIVGGFFVSVFYYPLFWTLLILSTALSGAVGKAITSKDGVKQKNALILPAHRS